MFRCLVNNIVFCSQGPSHFLICGDARDSTSCNAGYLRSSGLRGARSWNVAGCVVVQAQTCELTGNAAESCVGEWEGLHGQARPAYLRVAAAERRKR